MSNSIKSHRELLKGYSLKFITDSESLPEEEQKSDQQKGVPTPPVQKPVPDCARIIDLIPFENLTLGSESFRSVMDHRRSRRRFLNEPLSLEELSFLLYATQGVQRIINDPRHGNPRSTLRPSPSGGARHPFETYTFVNRVTGLDPGIYRYLPLDHKLVFVYNDEHLPMRLNEGCCDQEFVGGSAVVFIWSTLPYRMEWRYLPRFSAKIIAQDSGHLCQNLYLAAESIGCGTCAIGAYVQEIMDEIIQVDGQDEFTMYVAPVGRIKPVAPIVLNESELASFTGDFAREDRTERILNISIKEEKLWLTTDDRSPMRLMPVSPDKFFLEIADDEITFTRDEKGVVLGFTVLQAGSVRVLKKIAKSDF
jgi:SagB-type dehydrogenase family enzyme